MRRAFEALPVAIKVSALSFGAPLVLLGLALVLSDLNAIVKSHSILGVTHVGLALGPVFALVGLSFLWPLLGSGHHR
jgi:hypothetical protein